MRALPIIVALAGPVILWACWLRFVLSRDGNRLLDDTFNFALWRWQDIHSPTDDRLYLRKLYLWRTPWQQTAIHWIKRPDPGRDPHDHPRDFVSLLVRGGYREARYGFSMAHMVSFGKDHVTIDHSATPKLVQLDIISRRRFSWAYRRAEDLHRIVSVDPGTISVVFWGRRRRQWGFQTSFGWVHWRRYLGLDRAAAGSVTDLRDRPSLLTRLRRWSAR